MLVKILLVDERKLIRETIKWLIEKSLNAKVTEAKDVQDALVEYRKSAFEIVIFDYSTINYDINSTINIFKEKNDSVKIFILTDEKQYEKTKKLENNDFTKVITYTLEKKKFLSSLQNCVKFDDKDFNLTKREINILKHIAKGNLNKEIAIALDITEQTVKNNISTLLKKMNASDRTQAVVMAIKYNIIKI